MLSSKQSNSKSECEFCLIDIAWSKLQAFLYSSPFVSEIINIANKTLFIFAVNVGFDVLIFQFF